MGACPKKIGWVERSEPHQPVLVRLADHAYMVPVVPPYNLNLESRHESERTNPPSP